MTASLLKTKPGKTYGKSINVEELLRVKFDEIIESEGLEGLPQSTKEAIHRAMRTANKIGYTNGYKSGVKVAK